MTSSRLRVVEVANGVAGSVTGRLLAGLGDDVVTFETSAGSALRRQAPFGADGVGLAFSALAAGKSGGVVPDDDTAAEVLHPYLADADVLVLGLTTGAAARLGLAADTLRARYPELVIVWITAFGRDGDLADLDGDSLLAEAYGGMATMIGVAGRRPLTLGGEQIATCAGVVGLLGVSAALIRRDQGHGGDLVDVVMSDVAAYADWKSDVGFHLTGRAPSRPSGAGGEWKMLHARDGWVGAIFQQQHWAAMVELIDHPVLRDPELANEAVRLERAQEWWPIVDDWAADRSAEAIYDEAQRLGLPFGWAVKASDLVASEQLRERGFIAPADGYDGTTPAVGSPARTSSEEWHGGPAPILGSASTAPAPWLPRSAAGDGRVDSRPQASEPLEGVVVLDFGTITAGAAATRILADLGATVVKVESVERPDTFRTWKMPEDTRIAREPGVPRQGSVYFPSNNVGKKAIAVDLKTEEGRALVRDLAARSDVFVENFRVGVASRLGIDEPTLRQVNPDLVYLSLSSQGQHGPESKNRSFGSTLDLLSGLASSTGYDEDRPMWSSSDVNWPDQLVSLVGAAFVLYWLAKGRTGLHLDVSQREAVSWTLATEIADFLVNEHDSEITGNRRQGAAPHDTYPALGDGWIAVSCRTDAERAGLAGCLGLPDLAEHGEAWWREHQDEVDRFLTEWSRGIPRDEAARRLRQHGVPAVPVMTAVDRAAQGGLRERLVQLPVEGAPVKGYPLRFQEYRLPVRTHAPAIGEDTVSVLRDIAGLDPDAIERLRQEGVVYIDALSTVAAP